MENPELEYGIYMHTAYIKADGWHEDIELWHVHFKDLQDACKYLGENAEMLIDQFPVEKFEIKPITDGNKDNNTAD